MAELRENLRAQSDAVKRLQAALAVREKVIEALVELVDDEMPGSLVGAEMERRSQLLAHRLGHQGMTLEEYLEATNMSRDEFLVGLQEDAIRAIKADLALRYVADAEGIEVTDEDVEAEIANLAARQDTTPHALRRQLESEDRLPEVRSGIRKSKALEWLIDHTEYVDEDGRVIDRSELQPPRPEEPEDAVNPDDPGNPGDSTDRARSEQEQVTPE